MPDNEFPIIGQMEQLVRQWTEKADDRAVFLSCYMRMTSNVLIENKPETFHDPIWVNTLLHHFAGYYFVALDAYEKKVATTPVIWLIAHNTAMETKKSVLQKLLLGVNAHINYDLSLTLYDLFHENWQQLSQNERDLYYEDYTRVNDIISITIDAVQDEIIAPEMPNMQMLDKILGRADEWLISKLIVAWREEVWNNAVNLLSAKNKEERDLIITQIEADAIRRNDAILSENWATTLFNIW